MPFWRFTLLTTAGCVPWILGLTLIGRAAGSKWTEWQDSLHYVDYAVVGLVVIGVLVLVVRSRRERRRPRGAAADAPPA